MFKMKEAMHAFVIASSFEFF